MSEYTKIVKKYNDLMDQEVAKLREECKHQTGEWTPNFDMRFGFSGYATRHCLLCGKLLEKRAAELDKQTYRPIIKDEDK